MTKSQPVLNLIVEQALAVSAAQIPCRRSAQSRSLRPKLHRCRHLPVVPPENSIRTKGGPISTSDGSAAGAVGRVDHLFIYSVPVSMVWGVRLVLLAGNPREIAEVTLRVGVVTRLACTDDEGHRPSVWR